MEVMIQLPDSVLYDDDDDDHVIYIQVRLLHVVLINIWLLYTKLLYDDRSDLIHFFYCLCLKPVIRMAPSCGQNVSFAYIIIFSCTFLCGVA